MFIIDKMHIQGQQQGTHTANARSICRTAYAHAKADNTKIIKHNIDNGGKAKGHGRQTWPLVHADKIRDAERKHIDGKKRNQNRHIVCDIWHECVISTQQYGNRLKKYQQNAGNHYTYAENGNNNFTKNSIGVSIQLFASVICMIC